MNHDQCIQDAENVLSSEESSADVDDLFGEDEVQGTEFKPRNLTCYISLLSSINILQIEYRSLKEQSEPKASAVSSKEPNQKRPRKDDTHRV